MAVNIDSAVVCIPMNVDAFILNKPVCESGLSRIAPITQPDYLGLRPVNSQIRADILPHVDVTSSQPASANSRITATETIPPRLDPGAPASDTRDTPPVRQNRVGVYVHWSLPKLYRAATGGAEGVEYAPKNQLLSNFNTTPSPTFRPVPNRWYVQRNIKSSVPAAPAAEQKRAWIVESDRLWSIDELDPTVDLETDVSPYVSDAVPISSPDAINAQSGVYIGAKLPADGWTENGTARRIKLTAMNSSNFTFADNAVHNPNVFSIVDSFQYQDAPGHTVVLDNVTADYFILGWHSIPEEDPFGQKTGIGGFIRDRMKALFLQPPAEFNNNTSSASTLCHGTIYNVQFNSTVKPPTPADDFAKLFTNDIKMEPVSVGTTPLDAVLSFVQAHEGNEVPIFGAGSNSVAQELLSIAQLLVATEDDYDSVVKASDLIYARNFAAAEGGRSWHYDGKAAAGGAPARPSTIPSNGATLSEVQLLRNVNDLQSQLDAATRKLKLKKWCLFAVWWAFVSDVQNSDPARITFYKDLLIKYRAETTALVTLISTPDTGLADQVQTIVRKDPLIITTVPPLVLARGIPQPAFFTRRDPTLCIAGMDNGWPTAYLGNVPVRFSWSIPYPGPGSQFSGMVNAPNLPHAMRILLQEAFATENHGDLLGFKQWKSQPWCPLYIEWEATYYHIPFDKWSVSLLSSPIDNNYPHVRYGIKEPLSDDPSNASDQRAVSGRAVLLPQSVLNLPAAVEQILSDPRVDLSDVQIADLRANIGKLQFALAELDGLTTNLLTLGQGSHVQPNFDLPGAPRSFPLQAALNAGLPIGFTLDDFDLIGEETALTPYGSLFDFSQALHPPFKGITHGQFRFSKLNIVDKFGQTVSAIPPQLLLKDSSSLKDTVYPCLGDQVCPGLVEGNQLNTVTPVTEVDLNLPGDYPLCPYVELTPAINQDTRLNAAFIVPQLDTASQFTGWRVSDDWEQPVFAWVVVNVADYALQFFTGDGVFYVEMSLGGPTDSVKSPNWQPFDPPRNPTAAVSTQLQELIAEMSDSTTGGPYLRSFSDMIFSAMDLMPYAPASYGSFATSIIGKVFALVNVGFSLELSLPPLESQVIPPLQPPPAGPSDADLLLSYEFPVKIGDKERPYDGVVGYFDSDNTTTGKTTWTKLHSYFTANGTPETHDPRVSILPENFETISPYYVEPEGPLMNGSFAASHAANLNVKTMLLDPFTPLHLYTPILPIKSLRLSAWCIQSALEKMSAFFHVGPVLITRDVASAYDATKAVSADDWAKKQLENAVSPDTADIRLPIAVGRKGSWNWLQPYPLSDAGDGKRRYNALQVGEEDGRMRLDPAPYTMVEGYLQLIQPLTKDDF